MIYRFLVIAVFLMFFTAHALQAKPKYQFKVASLAPDGSVWITHFRDFANDVAEKSNGQIEMKLYPGGVMGDDLAMYRKLRAGQLHGGGFTMTGIGNAVPDYRVMSIPFYFNNYNEVDAVKKEMEPYFKDKFQQSGLELLAMTEVGFIYGMSTEPTSTLNDLQMRKSWIPSRDPIATEYFNALNITPVPLSISDVLPSLQTGLIDTVYTSLYGSIVMQWFSKAKFITDYPYGYAYGAVVFSNKAFSQLPNDLAAMMRESANIHFSALNKKTRETDFESRDVLLQNGVTFVQASEAMLQQLKSKKDEAVEQLIGQAISKETYDKVNSAVGKFRDTQ